MLLLFSLERFISYSYKEELACMIIILTIYEIWYQLNISSLDRQCWHCILWFVFNGRNELNQYNWFSFWYSYLGIVQSGLDRSNRKGQWKGSSRRYVQLWQATRRRSLYVGRKGCEVYTLLYYLCFYIFVCFIL